MNVSCETFKTHQTHQSFQINSLIAQGIALKEISPASNLLKKILNLKQNANNAF